MSKTQAMMPWQYIFLLASLVLWPVLLVEGSVLPTEQVSAKQPLQQPGQAADSASTAMPEGLRKALRTQLQTIEPEEGAALAYRTLNVAQDLSIRFEPSGVRVTPRQGKDVKRKDTWQWGVELSSYGYPGNLKPVETAKMRTDGNRIEYRRGDLTEWYVNDARGLEQSFTLTAPPERGQIANKPLVLEFALSGGLQPHSDKDGLGIRFTGKDGRAALNYSGLQAFDAECRILTARLTVKSEWLRIEVEDRQATYPITIDPWIQQAKLLAGDGAANDYFGGSVVHNNFIALIVACRDIGLLSKKPFISGGGVRL